MTDKKRVVFNITIEASADLEIEDLWPDGDAPENPTVEDVEKLIESDGGPKRILRDWNLDSDLAVDVTRYELPVRRKR